MHRSLLRLLPLTALLLLPPATTQQTAAQQTEAPVQAPLPQGAPAGMAHIDQDDLRRHAFHLASDELGGRYTSTPGQIAAAGYIADHLEALGFEPLGDVVGDDGPSYFQSYPVVKTFLDPQRTGLRFGDDQHSRGFGVLAGTEVDVVDVDGELIYLGRGARGDLPKTVEEGQIPFVLLRSRARSGLRIEVQFMMGMGMFRKAQQIAARLVRAGAPCVLFGTLHDDSGSGEMLNYTGLMPGKPLLRYDGDDGMSGLVGNVRVAVPMVFLSRATTESALSSLGFTVDEDDKLVDNGGGEGDAHVRIAVAVDQDAEALNVVGVLRGTDPELADEAVLFSAHMDHMGVRLDGQVFHGADDNGSGTAAFLEIAEAFAKGERPRRSVVFLSVSAEELGLWGSDWYSKHPTWPLPDIVANVNIDMIGRIADLSGPEEISITPSHRHPKYSSIAQGAARLADSVGLGLTSGDMFYERSDHYKFAIKGIPVVFFCDGEHEDYHQISDTADKLHYPKIERVTRLAFWIGHQVANDDQRPVEVGRQPAWFE